MIFVIVHWIFVSKYSTTFAKWFGVVISPLSTMISIRIMFDHCHCQKYPFPQSNRCFKELTKFRRKKLPQRVHLLEGGLKSYLAKFHLNSTYGSKGLPLPRSDPIPLVYICLLSFLHAKIILRCQNIFDKSREVISDQFEPSVPSHPSTLTAQQCYIIL